MNLDELLTTDRAVITVTETARLLELDERTVHRGIADGDIPAVKVGRRVLVPVRRLLPLLTDVPTSENSEPGALTPGHATTESANGGPTHDQHASIASALRRVS